MFDNVTQGTIYSPRWPGSYQHNLNCRWMIKPPKRSKNSEKKLFQITFTFVHFDLEEQNDQLNFYVNRSSDIGDLVKVARLHGSHRPADFLIPLDVNVNYIDIEFVSDEEEKFEGFTIFFKSESTKS